MREDEQERRGRSVHREGTQDEQDHSRRRALDTAIARSAPAASAARPRSHDRGRYERRTVWAPAGRGIPTKAWLTVTVGSMRSPSRATQPGQSGIEVAI